MSDITLIGLGAMGSAIARALLGNKCDLTTWNRSENNSKAMIELGAKNAASLTEAILASPTVLICINGYSAARSLLNDSKITPLLNNRTVIQLSTGTPGEAREMEKWIQQQGGHYLDGSIMVYPESIGSEQGQILVSGEEKVFRNSETYLDFLGDDIRYLGSKIGAAAALDLATVTRLVVNTVGVIHGANVCQSEGVSLEQFAAMFPEGDRAHSLAMKIHNNQFEDNISASVDVSIGVISSILRQADDLGINNELPRFLLGLYERANAAGYGRLDNASLIKILRKNPC